MSFDAPTEPITARLDPSPRSVGLTLRWLVIACLVARALTTVALVGPNVRVLEPDELALAGLGLVVLLYDLALLQGVWAGWAARLLEARWFIAFDVGFAVVVNLVVAAAIEPGTFWTPSRDLLGAFLSATVAMWTIVRWPRSGARAGAALIVVFLLEQFASAALNSAPMDGAAWIELTVRVAWLFGMMAPGMGVLLLAEPAITLAAARAAEHAQRQRLAHLHDTVLQGLTLIVRTTRIPDAPREVLAQIRELAAAQQRIADDLMPPPARSTLQVDLAAVCAEARAASVDVELTIDTERGTHSEVAREAVGAVREALTNVRKYAGAVARVRLSEVPGGLTITISDRGPGMPFSRSGPPGFGLRNSIGRRMEAVGGTAEVSTTGIGTEILLWLPEDAAPADRRIVENALSWFVRVPLGLRIVLLAATVVGAPLGLGPHAGQYAMVSVVLAVVNLALLAAEATPRTAWLLRTRGFLTADILVTATFALWTATLLPQGTATQLTLVSTTIYVVPTLPLWMVLRKRANRAGLLVGALVLEFLAAWVNGVPPVWSSVPQVLLHSLQVIVAFVLALVVMWFARGGVGEAVREERANVFIAMDKVTRRAVAALDRIAEHTRGAADAAAVRSIRGVALVALVELDTLLQPPSSTLTTALSAVASGFRRLGLEVRLSDRNIPDMLPADVIDSVAAATRLALDSILETTGGGGPVTVRATLLRDGALRISIRDPEPHIHPHAREIEDAMTGIGGSAEHSPTADGGTRVRLTWRPR